jgi:sulfite exporter TauE/SafE
MIEALSGLSVLGALLLGLAQSGHCALMCGPLALGCAARCGKQPAWSSLLLTHALRIATYVVLAVLVQQTGAVVLRWLPQDSVAIIGRLFLLLGLLLGVGLLLGAPRLRNWLEKPGHRLLGRTVVGLQQRVRGGSWWLPGVLWGLLPCAAVYALLVTAVAAATPWTAALTMLSFGLGTLPVLLLISFGGVRLNRVIQQRHNRWIAAGLLLALSLTLSLQGMQHGVAGLLGCVN